MKVEDLNLSVRSRNALARAGIRTLEQLQSLSTMDLMRLRNIGTKCIDEIQSVLKRVEENGLPETKPTVNMYQLGRMDGVEVMRTAAIQELLVMAGDVRGAESAALHDAVAVIRKLEIP